MLNALAAANDSASQLFENSSIFPHPSPETDTFADYTKKKHPGFAQKSTDGFPSCYAQVGPNGVVAFIPATRDENNA